MKLPKVLSLSALKWIAMITMLIDHMAFILIIDADKNLKLLYIIGRLIGRLSFPLFCFALVEGYIHTSNLKKYLLRLVCFAMVAEPCYDLAFHGSYIYWNDQNVIWTLIIGILVMYAVDKYGKDIIAKGLIVALGAVLAWILRIDYLWFGVLLIAILYVLKDDKSWQTGLCSMLLLFQFTAVFSLIPMNMYKGTKGKSVKWLFYVFYPGHLLLLHWLSQLMIKGIL